MSELKPCPFCGEDVYLEEFAGKPVIECDCGCKFEPVLMTEEATIAAWNRRAQP